MVGEFGAKRIFKDIDDIPIGANFKETIENAVDSCQIMLVIIGKHWAEEKDEQGNKGQSRMRMRKNVKLFRIKG